MPDNGPLSRNRRFGLYYVLDAEHHVVEATSLLEWGRWFENVSNRLVDWTQITSEVTVSTVFLGIDHRHWGEGPPIVFETMIFGGPRDGEMWRYSSWDDAVTGHAVAVKKVRAENVND